MIPSQSPANQRASLRRLRRPIILILAILATAVLSAIVLVPQRASAESLFGRSHDGAKADSDSRAVELGVRFVSSKSGRVVGIRFYKSSSDQGRHVGTLWSAEGRALATVVFTSETRSGWQAAQFSEPVEISAHEEYVASYVAPAGRYSAANRYFDNPYQRGALAVPAGGGVYSYSPGEFPTHTWENSNYFVDILFTSSAGVSSQPVLSPNPATSAPTSVPSGELNLPRIPWEGGPAYWKRFSKTDAAGWDDPSFFPIIVWFNGISNDDEVKYDKALGINTYIGMWEGTPYRLFEDNGVFWAGGKLNETFTEDSRNWVGVFLDDEVDGRFSPAEGRAHLQQLMKQYAGRGRFTYANYTQMVISRDMKPADAEAYVNDFSDVVSLDMYWYTIPYCSQRPYRDVYLQPIAERHCRTSSSYGRAVSALRERDAADGTYKPIWQWIENMNGGPGEGPFVANISPAQLKGAVMSSLIHESRGIAYFNQSHTGSCQGGAIFRQAQMAGPSFCGAAQVIAARQINTEIKALAPVLNTQSYEYSFGSGLDTMLKARAGYAYVFAMVDGNSNPGSRNLKLPPAVKGRSVEVVSENRTLNADANGRFVDSFDQEYSYHIYRIKI